MIAEKLKVYIVIISVLSVVGGQSADVLSSDRVLERMRVNVQVRISISLSLPPSFSPSHTLHTHTHIYLSYSTHTDISPHTHTHTLTSPYSPHTDISCPSFHTSCEDDLECYPNTYACDGLEHCANGLDELNCKF